MKRTTVLSFYRLLGDILRLYATYATEGSQSHETGEEEGSQSYETEEEEGRQSLDDVHNR